MGTLLDQPARDYKHTTSRGSLDLVHEIKVISKEADISFDQALRIFELKELQRRNDLMVANGDIHDEQMSGFGDILEGIKMALESLSEK